MVHLGKLIREFTRMFTLLNEIHAKTCPRVEKVENNIRASRRRIKTLEIV